MQRQKHVASYSNVKRVSCGTHEQNTAMVWLTLFFLKGKPPENMTYTARMISTAAARWQRERSVIGFCNSHRETVQARRQ